MYAILHLKNHRGADQCNVDVLLREQNDEVPDDGIWNFQVQPYMSRLHAFEFLTRRVLEKEQKR